jgi:hypothetical protein
MKVVAARNVSTSFISRKKNRKKGERELTKEEISLISQDKDSGQNSIIPVMNKLLWFSLVMLLCGCGDGDRDNSQSNSGKTEYKGLIIDPAIKGKMPRRNSDTSILSFAALDIRMFENDKPVDRPFIAGNGMPCYAVAMYEGDTLRMTLVPLLPAFGINIQKYKDSCRVSYAFSIHEETTGPYRLHPTDSITRPGLVVPCRFTVIFDKTEYKNWEYAYGFVEGVSDHYYIKTESGDTRARVEFKGYFRVRITNDSPPGQ